MNSTITSAVCFIANSIGPADHFATFYEVLHAKGHNVTVMASGPAIGKFKDRRVEILYEYGLDDQKSEAEKIAKRCKDFSVIITSAHHPFDIQLQQALAIHAPNTRRFAYYDNPDPYVPGGYSDVAAQVIELAHGVIFANAHYATEPVFRSEDDKDEINLKDKIRVGLGFYPLEQAEKLKESKAQNQVKARLKFIEDAAIKDANQKIITYFGGNNEVYFKQALRAYLDICHKAQVPLKDFISLFQQHPGAKAKNIDGEMIQEWNKTHDEKIIISTLPYDQACLITDCACYYQTSAGPQFLLAGMSPLQVAHKINRDNLVRKSLCATACDAAPFIEHLMKVQKGEITQVPKEKLLETLGIKSDWRERLEAIIKCDTQ